MPRKYVKKTNASYSDASLMLALKDIEKGKTIYAASLEYGIPYPTLRRWAIKKPNHRGQGREPWLTKEEEKCIVDSLKFHVQCGLPFDRSDVSNIIETYFNSPNSRASPFGNKPPGHDYLRNFEKRWSKELIKREPEILIKNRARLFTKEIVDTFFKKYATIIEKNNLQGHPERIFYLDEFGLGMDCKRSSVFVPKLNRNSHMISPTYGKTTFSVVFCVSASGNYLPPFTVYKGEHLYETWTKNGPSGGLYAVTESGWMQDSVFESWMKHFVNHTKAINKPILLIYDGYGTHMTFGTIAAARENGIIILCLPPHISHALQPLDVDVFAPLKETWKEILKNWFCESRLQNFSEAVFPSLLKELTDSFSSKNAVKGFKGSGLYPVNKVEVEKRIAVQMFNNKPSTSKEEVEFIPSVSKNDNEASVDSKVVTSPLKELKLAILSTLASPASSSTNIAMKNSKRKREHVKATAGEVLTANMVAAHLQEKHDERRIKKVRHSVETVVLKKPNTTNQKKIEEKIKSGTTITPFIVTLKS